MGRLSPVVRALDHATGESPADRSNRAPDRKMVHAADRSTEERPDRPAARPSIAGWSMARTTPRHGEARVLDHVGARARHASRNTLRQGEARVPDHVGADCPPLADGPRTGPLDRREPIGSGEAGPWMQNGPRRGPIDRRAPGALLRSGLRSTDGPWRGPQPEPGRRPGRGTRQRLKRISSTSPSLTW